VELDALPGARLRGAAASIVPRVDRSKATVLVKIRFIATLSDAALSAWRAANVGFVFQLYNLMPVLTAFENVELPLLLTGLSGRERQEHVDLVLELVGLTRRRRHYPSELSGGEQQRVAIARAVVTDPRIIVANDRRSGSGLGRRGPGPDGDPERGDRQDHHHGHPRPLGRFPGAPRPAPGQGGLERWGRVGDPLDAGWIGP